LTQTIIPAAKLTCVAISTIHRCMHCAPMPGFYRIVWEIGDPNLLGDETAVRRMCSHCLYGKVICAN
jgi:hypothetical protein